MRIVDEPSDADLLARFLAPDPAYPRSPGLHLSDITGDLRRQLEPERFGGPIHPEYIGIGLAFERFLETLLPGERPGELTCDGILCSPDWIHADGTLCEFKVTWTSSIEGLAHPKLTRYHMQAKAYCRVLRADTMRFYVLWVNGDYRPPRPSFKIYEVTYTPLEIEENWELIVTHGKDCGLIVSPTARQRKTVKCWCRTCGRAFAARPDARGVYCCAACRPSRKGVLLGGRSTSAGRKRAASAYEIFKGTPCDVCGNVRKLDRHHKDTNTLNNAPDNIQLLCRSCHMRYHKQEGKGRSRATA